MTTANEIGSSVLDTAHWVAGYRASESARADALFRDPLAAKLAGTAGKSAPPGIPTWPMVIRTKLIDDLVAAALAEGADRILNLAAGLDTRPYRLALPASLTWIEADFPAMVEHKEQLLAGETPRCKLEREKLDLSDVSARRAFLDRALQGAKRALVITEGFLLYLPEASVQAIGRDLAARPEIHWWIIDACSPATLRMLKQQTDASLAADSRMQFAPANGTGFFAKLGWKPKEIRSLIWWAGELKRLPFLLNLVRYLPEAKHDNPGKKRWGAVVRLERAS